MSEPQRPIRYPAGDDSGRFAPNSRTSSAGASSSNASTSASESGSDAGVPQESVPLTPPVSGDQRAYFGPSSTAQGNPAPFPGAPAAPTASYSVKTARKSGPGWGALIVAMVVTALVAVAAVFGIWGSDSPFSASPDMTDTTGEPASVISQSGAEVVEPVETTEGAADWEAVAAAVGPATVSIYVEGETESASGSGVIIDGAGHVVTNNHVISGVGQTGSITVTLHDGRLYSASIVGADATTDLAVLALDNPPSDLTAALLGDSSTLEVGQPVMAIGAPLGLADTVTTGIISALDRPVAVQGSVDVQTQQAEVVVTNAIQVDASINPGNSGGPLFDSSGAVIGINSSIASTSSDSSSAGSIGLGFAIPVNLAKTIVDQILETGSAQHALLGVQIQTAAVEVEEGQRLGAHVAAVVPGGAADLGGLQTGDVIVGIDGKSVTSGPALTGYVRRYQAGDSVELEVVRDGVTQNVTVTLQQKEA